MHEDNSQPRPRSIDRLTTNHLNSSVERSTDDEPPQLRLRLPSPSQIQAALPDLAPKAAQSWPAGQETVAGAPATLAAFDAPGGTTNVAWLSSLCVEGKHSSLTVLNGPLTDVPHLVSCATVNEAASTMSLFIDWRPRAYGAYEMRNEDGSCKFGLEPPRRPTTSAPFLSHFEACAGQLKLLLICYFYSPN